MIICTQHLKVKALTYPLHAIEYIPQKLHHHLAQGELP